MKRNVKLLSLVIIRFGLQPRVGKWLRRNLLEHVGSGLPGDRSDCYQSFDRDTVWYDAGDTTYVVDCEGGSCTCSVIYEN